MNWPKRKLNLSEAAQFYSTNLSQWLTQPDSLRRFSGIAVNGCCLLGLHTLILLVLAGYAVLPTLVLSYLLPLWLALFLGLPLGAVGVASVLMGLKAWGAGADGIMPFLIALVCVLILLPVFQRAKQNAERSRAKAQATATAKTKSPIVNPAVP